MRARTSLRAGMPGGGVRRTLTSVALCHRKSKSKETELSRHPWIRATALALALPACMAAQATSFDLRSVQTYRGWAAFSDPETAPQGFQDLFNNASLTTGPAFYGGLTTPASLYSVIGGSAPIELTPGDLTTPAPSNTPAGRVRFDQANAAAPALIQVNGVAYSNQSYRLNLTNPTQGAFLSSSQTRFMAEAYFGFVAPAADERYGVRFSDATGVVGSSFDDIIRWTWCAWGTAPRACKCAG